MEQLYPGVHSIQGKLGSRWLTQYLLVGERMLLMDTGIKGSAESDIYPYMKLVGLHHTSLDYVFITHADVDHFGDNATIRKDNPAAKFVCHTLDRECIEDVDFILKNRYGWYDKYHLGYPVATFNWLRDVTAANVRMDMTLSGEEWIQLSADWSVQVLHLPGHTSGHLGIWDPVNAAAYISDAVMGMGLVNRQRKLISPPPYFHVASYRNTIHKLLALQPKALYTAHYLPIKGKKVNEFLMESLYFTERVEQEIINTLKESLKPMCLLDLTEKVNEKTGPFTEMINELAGPVLAHLKDLMARNEVVLTLEEGQFTWIAL